MNIVKDADCAAVKLASCDFIDLHKENPVESTTCLKYLWFLNCGRDKERLLTQTNLLHSRPSQVSAFVGKSFYFRNQFLGPADVSHLIEWKGPVWESRWGNSWV